jgi:hypothetical protein
MASGHFKDAILDDLAHRANVAQFVSFGPDLAQRFAWIRGYPPNHRFASLEAAVAAILASSPESSVNIRSYEPDNPKSREFLYGRKDAGEVVAEVRRLAGEGLYTMVNETVDIHDGGVSGVAFGQVLEIAPEDTPRAVEKPGTAALPREMGLCLLQKVYGFQPELPARTELRVEFSIHPLRRGYHHTHTILWETEEPGPHPTEVHPTWPNRFSRFMGDKAFGLLVADTLGLPVPRTLVIPRKLPPFRFGTDTGLAETWIRTCPTEQVPGFFTTRRGWIDPFRLLQEEDPTGQAIASVLCQQGVDARFSGALLAQPDGEPLIEGVSGEGDEFMLGERAPEELPEAVRSQALDLYQRARERLGPVRFEWVADGAAVWIVQLHSGASATAGRTIFPGDAIRYHSLQVTAGIGALRELIARVQGTGEGIVLVGHVGVTSHLGDLLRRARIPSRIEDPAA